jgi:hypothetical protein
MPKHPVLLRTTPRTSLLEGLALLALLALIATTGCAPRTLVNQGREAIPAAVAALDPMIMSPEARLAGQRIIRFDNMGAGSDRAARRRDADRTMSETCAGGDYRTGSEGSSAVQGVVTAWPRAAGPAVATEFWYIQYVCVLGESPTEPSRPAR